MIKKIFDLWDNHSIGCCRVLFALSILAAFCEPFRNFFIGFCTMLWLIVYTGYRKKWDEGKNDNDTE